MDPKRSFDDPSDKDTPRVPETQAPARVAHDQPVEFPESETAVSQADGVP